MIELKLTFMTFDEAADAMMKLAGSFDPAFEAARWGTRPDGSMVTMDEALAARDAAKAGEPAKRTRRTKAEAEAAAGATTSPTVAPAADKPPVTSTSEAAGSTQAALTPEEAQAKFVGEVRPAMAKVMAKIGSDNARQFLADFQGVELAKSKLSDTPVDRYDDLIKACEAKLAE